MTAPTNQPSKPTSNRFAYIPGLDGIRGFWVVLGPLMYHARPDVIPGGILGIDLFFVLSSYLITSILLAEHDRSGRIDLVAYAGRRARRLLPALLVCLSALTVYMVIYRDEVDVSRWTGAIVSTLLYVANWFEIASGTSYFEQFTYHPLRHVWSFSIEEQFYVFAPLFLLLILRFSRRNPDRSLLVLTVGGSLLSAWWMAVLYEGGDPSRVYYGTDTRAHSLLVGMAFAVVARMWGPVRTEWGRRTLVAGAYGATAFFLWAVFNLSERDEFMFDNGGFLVVALISAVYVYGIVQPSAGPFPRALGRLERTTPNRVIAGVAAGAVLVGAWLMVEELNGGSVREHLLYLLPAAAVAAAYGASLPDRGPLHWFLESAAVRWVGKISYGLYLYHWPIYLLVTPERAGRLIPGREVVTGNALVALHLALTFAVATASFYLVEQPVVQRRLPIVRSPLVPAPAALVGAGFVVAIVAGLLFVNTSGPASAETANGARVEVILPPGVGPEDRILVVGDSVAVQIAEELKSWAREHPGQVVVFSDAHIGCVIGRYGEKIAPGEAPGEVGDVCSAWNDPVDPEQAVLPTVVSWPTIVDVFQPTIVVGHITPWDVTDRLVPSLGDVWTHVGNPDFDAYIQSEYRLASEVLGARGATVYWLEGAHLNKPVVPQNDPARIDRLNRLVREATADLDHVRFLDYPAFIGGVGTDREVIMRDDGVHLSQRGLDEIVPWLLTEVGVPLPPEPA
jgi:peptidoglycan/LPS O-acetylase OafA/YrhL